jgi:hypothetical protein
LAISLAIAGCGCSDGSESSTLTGGDAEVDGADVSGGGPADPFGPPDASPFPGGGGAKDVALPDDTDLSEADAPTDSMGAADVDASGDGDFDATPEDPCPWDGLCDAACGVADPDCPAEVNPCEADGACNEAECAVGEDPDCPKEPAATCEADGKCLQSCWESDPDCGCAGLGIATSWKGTFEGVIPYKWVVGGDGDQDVEGDLAFDIDCFAAKYIVDGQMTGAEDNGVPFSVHLSGFYDPAKQEIDAKMLEGEVNFIFAQVFFEGTFKGAIVGDHFEGTWDGASTGTSLGDLLTATGSGTWVAYPAP